MSAHHPAIEAAVEDAELEYRYAPLPSHTSLERAWRERAYYASREIPGIAEEVREAPAIVLVPAWILLGATLVFGVYTELPVDVARAAAQMLLVGGL